MRNRYMDEINLAFDELTNAIRYKWDAPKTGLNYGKIQGQRFCKGTCDASKEGKPSKNPYDKHYFCRSCGIGDGVWGLKVNLIKGRCPCCNRNVSVRPKKSKVHI